MMRSELRSCRNCSLNIEMTTAPVLAVSTTSLQPRKDSCAFGQTPALAPLCKLRKLDINFKTSFWPSDCYEIKVDPEAQ